MSLTFLAPDSAWTASLVDPNLASVVALVRVGDVRMLLMGDAERPEEDWLLRTRGSAICMRTFSRWATTAASTSSSDRFLDAVRPRLALVSVGAGNSYHLPTPSIMRALAAHGAQVLRTDQLGTIVVRTDGHRIFDRRRGRLMGIAASLAAMACAVSADRGRCRRTSSRAIRSWRGRRGGAAGSRARRRVVLGQSTVSAITLWRTIWLAPDVMPSDELLLHELRHVDQFEASAAFPLLYLWQSAAPRLC